MSEDLLPYRRSMRLRGYDYSRAGMYFVTICVRDHECVFGDVVDGEMRLNEWGRVVDECWKNIATYFPHVKLDAYVIMPNHPYIQPNRQWVQKK